MELDFLTPFLINKNTVKYVTYNKYHVQALLLFERRP